MASLEETNPQLYQLQTLRDRARTMQPHEFQMAEPAPNLQGKVLIFYGFFKESVSESAMERFRVREVRFLYYLEDDTLEIIEHNEPNSGIQQGIPPRPSRCVCVCRSIFVCVCVRVFCVHITHSLQFVDPDRCAAIRSSVCILGEVVVVVEGHPY